MGISFIVRHITYFVMNVAINKFSVLFTNLFFDSVKIDYNGKAAV